MGGRSELRSGQIDHFGVALEVGAGGCGPVKPSIFSRKSQGGGINVSIKESINNEWAESANQPMND